VPDLGNVGGDNDPVDIVEIGSAACAMGGVYPVKALGALAMIDDGEVDWKVLAIRADDPLAAKLNDVADVERELPGEIEKVRVWFRDYKIPDGKPANEFGYGDKPVDKAFTDAIIAETHEFYNRLKSGRRENTEELSLI
jgi:inorganic pyrophosphatase